jgi:Transposase DDE domain
MQSLLFKKLRAVVTQINHQFRLVKKETSTSGRPRKISSIDAMTLSLYQHHSTRATKKSVYEDFKEELNCSYKTLVVSMNRSAILCLRLIHIIIRWGRQHQNLVKYTDATDIPVCLKKNADHHKTMAGLASLGHSSKGWYYGLKMTLTRDKDGRMLGLQFTNATANDRDIFRKINRDIYGIIVADAGYVSKKLENDMNIDYKRWVLIRPYKSMKKLMTTWQEELYHGRFQIEFDFRSLKMFHGLITSLPRSINGYLANYIHALTSFVLR